MPKLVLRKSQKKRIKLFMVSILVIITFIVLFLFKLGNSVNEFILNLSEIEVKRLSKEILTEAVNKTLINAIDLSDLFIVERDVKGNVKTIDINSKKANQILIILNSNVNGYIKELELGKSSIVDIESNLLINRKFFSNKSGLIFEIPVGVVTKNAFLSNLGPKIPVRISLNGDLKSQLLTEVESYGINNAIIKVYVSINVSEQIILPLTSREVSLTSDIVIGMKMIQGDIPSYYFDTNSFNKPDDSG